MYRKILPNHSIALLWFWKEWLSSYRYLKSKWITNITILDNRIFADFSIHEQEILLWEKHILWSEYVNELNKYDIIIKSPWISPYWEKIKSARSKITSQAEIFFHEYAWKIIAVTGTKWKSTTTSLIYSILKTAWFSVGLVGNIWNPVLDALNEKYDFVVFEMSSYMLDGIDINPFISVIVNIYPEHLDYHEWFENYKNAKLAVIGKTSHIIYPLELSYFLQNIRNNLTSVGTDGDIFSSDGFIIYKWGEKIVDESKISLLWKHNIQNISLAIGVGKVLWIKKKDIENAVYEFGGLHHRLEKVGEKNGITFYDDAISTTPESTIAAILAIKNTNTIFLWWTDRWYSFEKLTHVIDLSEIENVVLFPDTGKKIWEFLKNSKRKYRILNTQSMQEAIEFAFQYTKIWKVCLLSCASPSYVLWKNFEEKWNAFQECIEKYRE